MSGDGKGFYAFCVALGCVGLGLGLLLVSIFTKEITFLVLAGVCAFGGIAQQLIRTPWGNP